MASTRSAWRRKLTLLLSFVFAIICNNITHLCLPSYSFHLANAVLIPLTSHPLMHTIQDSEKDSSCKAADQPLPCSTGVVCYLCRQHSIYWCTGTLRAGLCTDALLLPGCLLLDGSWSNPLAQEAGVCVQTRHLSLCPYRHGSMLGYVGWCIWWSRHNISNDLHLSIAINFLCIFPFSFLQAFLHSQWSSP